MRHGVTDIRQHYVRSKVIEGYQDVPYRLVELPESVGLVEQTCSFVAHHEALGVAIVRDAFEAAIHLGNVPALEGLEGLVVLHFILQHFDLVCPSKLAYSSESSTLPILNVAELDLDDEFSA